MANLSNINNKFLVTTGGNVGIGVTGPLYKLEASGADFNFVGKFQATGTGYAPASILLETTGSASRGQGMYHYNTTADENWFTGVPYNVDSQKWIVAHQSSTSQLVETAQLTHALLTIASLTGNVGIGETSPGTKLVVSGNNDAAGTGVLEIKTTGTNLRIGGNTTYSWIQSHSSNPLYINQLGNNIILNSGGGNVGIGTTTPGNKLHVVGNMTIGSGATNEAVRTILTGGTLTLQATDANHRIIIRGTQSTNGTITGNSNNIDFYEFGGYNFYTGVNTGTGARTLALTINSSGNVGIGTNNPQTSLEVNGGLVKVVDSGDTAFYGGDYVRVFGTQSYGFRNSAGSAIAQISLTGNSYFNGGNVGIGTTSPIAKLDIDGDVNTTGYLANTLEFSTYFGSGTTVIATLHGNFEPGTTAVASIEYVGLYAYAGTSNTLGLIMASTRRSNNNTAWSNVNDETVHVAGSTSSEPTLFWDNGVLKITVSSSVQISCRIRITYHGSNTGLTRNHSA